MSYPPPQQGHPYPAPQHGQPPPQTMAVAPLVFGRGPADIQCNNCNKQVQTKLDHEMGRGSWMIAFGLFFITGICCFLPCVLDGLKDVIHVCPSCNHIAGKKTIW